MKKEYLYAGTSVLCFGTVATVSKLLMNQLDALYVLAFSFLFATLFLGVYNWKKGFLCEVKKLTARIWIRMILIGSLGVFFYNYFLLLGTARLKAQTAFVINELWPALIILLSCWILKRKDESGKSSCCYFFFSWNSGRYNRRKSGGIFAGRFQRCFLCTDGGRVLWHVLYFK